MQIFLWEYNVLSMDPYVFKPPSAATVVPANAAWPPGAVAWARRWQLPPRPARCIERPTIGASSSGIAPVSSVATYPVTVIRVEKNSTLIAVAFWRNSGSKVWKKLPIFEYNATPEREFDGLAHVVSPWLWLAVWCLPGQIFWKTGSTL